MGRTPKDEMMRFVVLVAALGLAGLADGRGAVASHPASSHFIGGDFDILAQLGAGAKAGATADVPDGHYTRMSCQSCRDISSDCETATVDGLQKITFPAVEVAVDFPCDDPFHQTPLVLLNVHGADNSKLYQASLKSSSSSGFKANIQRVDDVEDPVMTCDAIKLCYIALAV